MAQSRRRSRPSAPREIFQTPACIMRSFENVNITWARYRTLITWAAAPIRKNCLPHWTDHLYQIPLLACSRTCPNQHSHHRQPVPMACRRIDYHTSRSHPWSTPHTKGERVGEILSAGIYPGSSFRVRFRFIEDDHCGKLFEDDQ